MSKAKELREKFDKELKELQDNCLHEKTNILPFMWAPGHYSGKVEFCIECDKILRNVPDPDEPQLMLSFAG